jgi:hypothetical protein
MAPPLCALLVLLSVTSGFGADRRPNSRLRCADDAAAAVVETALAQSPTVRRLVDEVERTDLIVLVRATMSMERARASTRFLTSTPTPHDAAAGPRYLLIELNPLGAPWDLVALFAHELQHAFEIGHDRSVQCEGDVARLYTRIGWSPKPGEYETAAAVDIGRDVRREVYQVEKQRDRALLAKR